MTKAVRSAREFVDRLDLTRYTNTAALETGIPLDMNRAMRAIRGAINDVFQACFPEPGVKEGDALRLANRFLEPEQGFPEPLRGEIAESTRWYDFARLFFQEYDIHYRICGMPLGLYMERLAMRVAAGELDRTDAVGDLAGKATDIMCAVPPDAAPPLRAQIWKQNQAVLGRFIQTIRQFTGATNFLQYMCLMLQHLGAQTPSADLLEQVGRLAKRYEVLLQHYAQELLPIFIACEVEIGQYETPEDIARACIAYRKKQQ